MIDEICQKILEELSLRESVDSQDLEYDSQAVFSALQRLSSLEMTIYDTKERLILSLTPDGQNIVLHGSPEFRLAQIVSKTGTEISKVVEFKHGLQQAITNGWISRQGKHIFLEKSPECDPTAEDLKNIATLSDQTLINKYKRYKLLTTKTERFYIIKKGPNFKTSFSKNATDLTSDMIMSRTFDNYDFKKYNYSTIGLLPQKGNLHPLTKVQIQISQIFLNMGFSEMKTNKWVESSFWNFDALFQPQNHPSRDAHDTFFVGNECEIDAPADYIERVKKIHESGGFGSKGYQNTWDMAEAKKLVLRTHTTSVSARYLYQIAQIFNQKKTKADVGQNPLSTAEAVTGGSNRIYLHNENHSGLQSTKAETLGNFLTNQDYKSVDLSHIHPNSVNNTSPDCGSINSKKSVYYRDPHDFNTQISQELRFQNAYKFYSIDKVFRNETSDATHLAEFHQIEGVIVGHDLTLGQLMGVLTEFYAQLGLSEIKFKPAYNPYTEPSMEIFGFHSGLQKWIEIGNSGIFRPEMLKPMGFEDSVTVFGWGLSLERPTMIKYGINNIRDLVGHKVCFDFIKNSEICLFN